MYRKLSEQGELERRVERGYRILEKCSLCPRQCRVNRLKGKKGFCQAGKLPLVSNFGPHFGEEVPLVGHRGSGTIFFTRCHLACQFCQNYHISQLGEGEEISLEELAQQMLSLERQGCHNINFVSPTHFAPQIIAALSLAIEGGLTIPLVYNCGGYESLETLHFLEGIIDIYMPDAKYSDLDKAQAYSKVSRYPQIMKAALKEMHRQVGDLIMNAEGIARRGLLVRHLILPYGLAGTQEIMRFLAREISPHTYVNIMDQYCPCYRAHDHPLLARRITSDEYREAIDLALKEGLRRGFSQRGGFRMFVSP